MINRRSTLRSAANRTADPKYEGVKTSRRELMDSDPDESSEDENEHAVTILSNEDVILSGTNEIPSHSDSELEDEQTSVNQTVLQLPMKWNETGLPTQLSRDDNYQKGSAIRKQMVCLSK